MSKTGNPAEIACLNHLLGTELGFNLYGAPIFSWRWSEDCFWPAAGFAQCDADTTALFDSGVNAVTTH